MKATLTVVLSLKMLKSLSHGFFIAKYSLCKKKRHGGVDKIVDDRSHPTENPKTVVMANHCMVATGAGQNQRLELLLGTLERFL